MFFPGPGDAPTGTKMPPSPPGPGDVDPHDDFDVLSSRYDAPDPFAALDDFGTGQTPALLAAKAEPLGRGAADGPPAGNRPGRSPRSGRPKNAADATRGAKARSQTRRKPKEPSKLLLAVGVIAVVLAGVGAAYLLTRSGDSSPTGDDVAGVEAGEATDTSLPDGGAATDEQVASPATALPPVVIFDEAAIGPVQAGTAYQIAIGDGPAEAMYQLLVDGAPVAEPAPALPPATFEAGRHLLVIEITSPAGAINTDPVVVYAVGEIPAAGFRANLSSVNIEGEGWAEAVRQYDEFVAAGHTDLKLMPSDWFASLLPGYWNLFVDGFETAAAATAYCEGFGLAVPDDCFPQRFDPDAPAGG